MEEPALRTEREQGGLALRGYGGSSSVLVVSSERRARRVWMSSAGDCSHSPSGLWVMEFSRTAASDDRLAGSGFLTEDGTGRGACVISLVASGLDGRLAQQQQRRWQPRGGKAAVRQANQDMGTLTAAAGGRYAVVARRGRMSGGGISARGRGSSASAHRSSILQTQRISAFFILATGSPTPLLMGRVVRL